MVQLPRLFAQGFLFLKSIGTGLFTRLRLITLVAVSVLALSGCVQYDVGVNFKSPNQGAIVQHIKVSERLSSLSNTTTQQWLDNVEQRARQVQGKTRRISKQEILVTIPFANGADLSEKFNTFFSFGKNPTAPGRVSLPGLPDLRSRFQLRQGNFLLWIRNRLILDLDLRSLGVSTGNGNLLVSPGSLLELEFRLNAPWGATSLNRTPGDAIAPVSVQQGRQLIWNLQPGQRNHIEAIFWMPNPLGIGTVVIVLLVAGGFYLKYSFQPSSPSVSGLAPEEQQ